MKILLNLEYTLNIVYARGTATISGQTGTQIGSALGADVLIKGHLTGGEATFATVDGFITNNPPNGGPHKRVLTSNGDGTFNANANFTISDTSFNIERNDINIQSQGPLDLRGSINMIGNITASGDISASGKIIAGDIINASDPETSGLFFRTTGTEIAGRLDVTQTVTATDITASGDISASGELIGIIDGGTF